MNIKSRLLMVLGLLIVSMLSISLVFVLTMERLSNIDKERKVLADLSLQILNLSVSLNSLDSAQIDSAIRNFNDTSSQVLATTSSLSKLRELPSLDPSLAKALSVVSSTMEIAKGEIESVKKIYSVLVAETKTFFHDTTNTTLRDFYTDSTVKREYDLTAVLDELNSLFISIVGSDKIVKKVIDAINAQSEVVDKGISIFKQSSLGFALIIAAAVAVVVGFLLLIIIRSITSRVGQINNGLLPLSTGDLTKKIAIKGADELASIAKAIDSLAENFGQIISSNKQRVFDSREVGHGLSAYMEQTATIIGQINALLDHSNTEMGNQSNALDENGKKLFTVLTFSKNLENELQNQSLLIEEITTFIEEMVGGIATVTRTTAAMEESISTLTLISDEGKKNLDSISNSISEMNQFSNNLNGAARLINSIAAQTEVLAMNAAIEAAHAGASGSGFAVVAEEIRSLADKVSSQAKSISHDLKLVWQGIGRIHHQSIVAQDSFATILDKTEGVSSFFAEIHQAIVEQDQGGKQVLNTVHQLLTGNRGVSQAAKESSESNRLMSESHEVLLAINQTINANNYMVRKSTHQILDSIIEIKNMAHKNKILIDAIESEMNKFKISEE